MCLQHSWGNDGRCYQRPVRTHKQRGGQQSSLEQYIYLLASFERRKKYPGSKGSLVGAESLKVTSPSKRLDFPPNLAQEYGTKPHLELSRHATLRTSNLCTYSARCHEARLRCTYSTRGGARRRQTDFVGSGLTSQADACINILLWILGWIPGVIHACVPARASQQRRLQRAEERRSQHRWWIISKNEIPNHPVAHQYSTAPHNSAPHYGTAGPNYAVPPGQPPAARY